MHLSGKTQKMPRNLQPEFNLYLIEPENHTIMTDCYTDNAIPVHVTAEQGQLSAGTATSSNPHFLQLWKNAYQCIRRCLVFYEHIGDVPMDEKKKRN